MPDTSGKPVGAILRARSCSEHGQRLVVERSYFSGVLPKFDMMAANQLFRPLKGYLIICAFERN
jgi:hypothetical protein